MRCFDSFGFGIKSKRPVRPLWTFRPLLLSVYCMGSENAGRSSGLAGGFCFSIVGVADYFYEV
jgi:hypothetical protein